MYLNLAYATQIIVESLPISSSTHVRIIECLFATTIPEHIDYLLHGPTLLILALFFRPAWIQPLMLLIKKNNAHRVILIKVILKIFSYALVATIPPAIFMFGVIKPWLGNTNFYTSNGLLIGGLMTTMLSLLSLLWVTRSNPSRPLTTSKALILGFVQALALLPGVSRFASTYVVGRWLGLSTKRAFEICFLIEVPLIMGAFLLGIHKLLHTHQQIFLTTSSIITIIVATIIGYLALWGMWVLAQRNQFWIIGLYLPIPIAIILCNMSSKF